jgi:hypothetical protein
VYVALLSTDNINTVLGVSKGVRKEESDMEFAILASNPVMMLFTQKLYRKGGTDCSCYYTASFKTEHWTEVCNVTNIEIKGKTCSF